MAKGITPDQIQQLYTQMKRILAYTITAGTNRLNKKVGFYELIGCDILLEENFKPYLLEMNTNPALFTGPFLLSGI